MPLNNQKKTLVTGAAGFIGSAIVWALNEQGYDNIITCDRLGETEKWKNLLPLTFSDYVDADDMLRRLKKNPDAFGPISHVFHLGACSSTSETNAQYLLKNNFEYTKVLARWATTRRVRFVYASSAATYGDGSLGMNDRMRDDLPKLRPLNPYGFSKHLFDCYAHRKGILNGIIGLKFFNVFGPNENHKGEMRSIVNKAYHEIMTTGKLRLFKSYHPKYPDGEQRRDFVYVKDVAEAALHLAGHPVAGGLFNIGSGQSSSFLEIAQMIFQILGKPPQIEFIEMPEAIRSSYQYETVADITNLRESGYRKPNTPLGDAIFDYLKNYLVPGLHLGDTLPT